MLTKINRSDTINVIRMFLQNYAGQFMIKIIILILLYVSIAASGGLGNRNADYFPSDEVQKSGKTPKIDYKTITSEQAKNMMDDGAPYTLVDVRTESEYKEGHIEGALLIPHDKIKDRAGTDLTDKTARILIYCRGGNRSAAAARTALSEESSKKGA